MIEEVYVSFEVAKLLKEKGFDEETIYYYQLNCYDEPILSGSTKNFYNRSTNKYCCCTLQVACKWLREIHNIHICVEPHLFIEDLWYASIYKKDKDDVIGCWYLIDHVEVLQNTNVEKCFEDAIEYCIKRLIK